MIAYIKAVEKALLQAHEYFVKLSNKGMLTPSEERVWKAVSKAIHYPKPDDNVYPNGQHRWLETYFYISIAIEEYANCDQDNRFQDTIIAKYVESQKLELYQLAKDCTNEFEVMYQGVKWDRLNDSYAKAIAQFCEDKLYSHKNED